MTAPSTRARMHTTRVDRIGYASGARDVCTVRAPWPTSSTTGADMTESTHHADGGALIPFPTGGIDQLRAIVANATPELLAFALLSQFVDDPDFTKSSRDEFRHCCTYVLARAERDA